MFGSRVWSVMLVSGLMGCAAQTVDSSSTVAEAGAPVAVAPAVAAYQLTAEEQKLDCPKLTGQMKVRMATMRGDMESKGASATGRAMQAVAAPVFGGTKRGADPAADLQRDRAKLEAFNRRLAEKKCKTLDIDAELRGGSPAAGPAKAVPKKPG